MNHNFRHTVTVSRSTVVGRKTTYEDVVSIACHIQPITDAYQLASMGRDGKFFRLFSTGEVRISDRLTDQDGAVYEVTGVSKLSFRSRNHYEATLRGV